MEKTPFKVHAFVCTNDRQGKSKSCADGNSQQLKDALKTALKEKGLWGNSVRVSTSGCLGLCAHGPNVYIYPQGKAMSECTMDDVPTILDEIVRLATVDEW